MELVRGDLGSKGRPTNWYALVGAMTSAVVILAAIFSLAEWRVINALSPVIELLKEQQHIIVHNTKDIVELRIAAAKREATNEEITRRIHIEEDALIRDRVGRVNKSLDATAVTKDLSK